MILDRLRAHSGKRQKPSAEVLLGRRQGSWLLGTALLTLVLKTFLEWRHGQSLAAAHRPR